MSDVLISRMKTLSHLKAALAQELISCSEMDLDDASNPCELLGSVVFDVSMPWTRNEGDVLKTKKKNKKKE
jgi:hypothetical protein